MKKLEFLKKIHTLLKYPDERSLSLSLANTHLEGIFSLVIGGTEFGRLTRIYIIDRILEPFDVQLHTHRYPLNLTVVKGRVKHHTADRVVTGNNEYVTLSEFQYRSPLNGGDGLKYEKETNVVLNEYTLPICSTIKMNENDFHTVSCSKGSIWIIEEKGFKSKYNSVLGVPFETQKLYDTPDNAQINKNLKIVLKEIKQLLSNYESSNKVSTVNETNEEELLVLD